MSGIDDLKAAIQGVADEQTAMSQSITNAVAAIEAAITKLQAGGLSDADAEALAQQLGTATQGLKDSQAILDAESQKLHQS